MPGTCDGVRFPVSLLEMQHKQSETLYPSATE